MLPRHVQLAKYLPWAGSGIVLLTLIICFCLKEANDFYVGGLTWPYFSDIGKDSPSYYIFVLGLTLASTALVLIYYINFLYHHALFMPLHQEQKMSIHIYRIHYVVGYMGVTSAISLPILSIFDTINFPTVHQYAAYWFFILQAFVTPMNTIISAYIYKHRITSSNDFTEVTSPLEVSSATTSSTHGDMSKEKKVYYWQMSLCLLFWIFFLIYIPIGQVIVCPYERLLIEKCLKLGLGADYCLAEENQLTATETKFFDYTNCIGTHQLLSISQLISILSLLVYTISFHFLPLKETPQTESNSTHEERSTL